MEPDSHEVDDDLKELIQDQLSSSRMIFKIESHLPLETKVKIFFSQNPENIFIHPDLVIGWIEVPSGELNGNGLVINSNSTQGEISLNHQELQVFTNAPFYLVGSLEFPGTNGETIKAWAADFIKLRAYLELDVKTNGL